MSQNSFLEEMEVLQCDLASGLAALGLVYQMFSEEDPKDSTEALYVAYAYLQGVHDTLRRAIAEQYE